mgnify:CR=1 FL=1
MQNLSDGSRAARTFDAIVVGSGISGGWAAKELTEKGLKTLVLERGRQVKHVEDYKTFAMNPWDFRYAGGRTPQDEIDKHYPKQARTGYTINDQWKHFFVKDDEHPYTEVKRFDWMRGYQVGGRSLVWALKTAEAERVKALSDTDFLAEFQRAFGRRAGRFTRVGQRHAYPLQLMVAHQQTVPRAVILGNAAHSLHPVAGQGFNLCLRDVLVLVDTLRDACAQGADLGESARWQAYEAKRQADQQQIIRFSDTLVRGFSNANPVLQLARNIGLLGFDLLPGAKPLVARYAMGLSHV